MVLSSHNSMTYLKPAKWYLYPFRFIAKCQSKTIQEQYEAGARVFDLRIVIPTGYLGYYDTPVFAHGLMTYKSPDINEVLAWLNSRDEKVYARILLERPDESVHNEFDRLLTEYEEKYPNIGFYQAADKKTWIPLHKCKSLLPKRSKDAYASCNQSGCNKWKGILKSKNWSGWLIDDLWPWLYAKIHNKKNFKKYKDEDMYLMVDFI